ncbi:hypothetical protein [Caldibacillus debilis]|uniref:Uncharacterized protein n=1 Tax=Caldibacillus debilis TaxID=301148 RepID=A0A150MAD4_9BACI|nr:hypothetical protein [Caldibacillus debilis]KYD21396.1 hypothetical protein B4135_1676 [Caldibacillus debilis]
MAVLSLDEIYNYSNQKLEAHFQNNDVFNEEMAILVQYFSIKIQNLLKENFTNELDEELFAAIKSQIFNGYFMATELLNHEDTAFPDEWFAQSPGMIAQQIPDILRNASNNDLEGTIIYDRFKNFMSKLIIQYERVFEPLLDIALNTAAFGAKWAFFDEAEKRGIKPYQPQHMGLLSYLDEMVFIYPDMYIFCDVLANDSEHWEIVQSKHTQLDKVGEVYVMKYLEADQEKYFLNVSLKNSLTLEEQRKIIDLMANSIFVGKGIEENQLFITACSVEDYFIVENK